MRKGVTQAALLTLLALVALVGVSSPAAAHAEFLFSTPEEGAVLDTAPPEVTLTFSDPVLPESVVVSVEDETGFVVRVLDLRVEGPDVFATWPPGMRGVQYSVNYRVVSEDGHPVEGAVHFSVRTAPTDGAAPVTSAAPSTETVATTPSAEGDSGGSTPILIPVLVGLAVGVIVGLIMFLISRRSAPPGSADANDTP